MKNQRYKIQEVLQPVSDICSLYKVSKNKEEFFMYEFQKMDVCDQYNFKILNKLAVCQHVLGVIEKYQENGNTYFITEYAQSDLLKLQINQPNRVFECHQALRIFAKLIQIAQQIHNNHFIYRNFRLENFKCHKKQFYLADFSMAQYVKRKQRYFQPVGLEIMMAPEFFTQDGYGYQVDIWALGVCLYFMLTQEYPFSNNNVKGGQIYIQILTKCKGGFSFSKAINSTKKKDHITKSATNQKLSDLFSKIFQIDYYERITIKELKRHPALKQFFKGTSIKHSHQQNQMPLHQINQSSGQYASSIFMSYLKSFPCSYQFHKQQVVLAFMENSSEILKLSFAEVFPERMREIVYFSILKVALLKCNHLLDVIYGKAQPKFKIGIQEWNEIRKTSAFTKVKQKIQRKKKIIEMLFKSSLVSIQDYKGDSKFYTNEMAKNFAQIKHIEKNILDIPTDQVFLFASIAQLVYDDKNIENIQILIEKQQQQKSTTQLQPHSQSQSHSQFQRFLLSNRMFSKVSKTFLKQFIKSKRLQDGFAQIFLQYLNELDKSQPIENQYSKDMKIYPHTNKMNLKMVQLFFMKYLAGYKIQQVKQVGGGSETGKEKNSSNSSSTNSSNSSKLLQNSIIDLKLRLCINNGKINQARKTFEQNIQKINFPFVYLRSIRDFPEEKQINERFYIVHCGKIFRKNIQIEKYTPLYDYYDEFLSFITRKVSFKGTNINETITTLTNHQTIITLQECYLFNNNNNNNNNQQNNEIKNIINHYYLSLKTQFYHLTQGQGNQIAQKSDYYKISQKGLLLQLIKIHKICSGGGVNNTLSEDKQFLSWLKRYFLLFSNKLTFLNEMQAYLPFLDKIFKQVNSNNDNNNDDAQQHITQSFIKTNNNIFTKKQDNLIFLINQQKLNAIMIKKNLTESWQLTQKYVVKYFEMYNVYKLQIEQNKPRQKGQVYFCDEFIIMIADIVINYVQYNFITIEEQQLVYVLRKTLQIIQFALENSPFNAYIKLKALYFSQKLNYYDLTLQIYQSLDIKSVQFQTLGYLVLNPLVNFNLFGQNEEMIIKMFRSYYQNQRETSEYCMRALRNGASSQMLEYFSYQKCLQKSFNKLFLFYCLFLKYKNQKHSTFYLDWIEKSIGQIKQPTGTAGKIFFNCDLKTMASFLNLGQSQQKKRLLVLQTNEVYGHLSSLKVFSFQVSLRKGQSMLSELIECSKQKQQEFKGNYVKLQEQIKILQNSHDQISKQCNDLQLYDLSEFQIIEDYLASTKSGKEQATNTKLQNTLSRQNVKFQLNLFVKISQLKLCGMKIGLELVKLINMYKSSTKQDTVDKCVIDNIQKDKQALIQMILTLVKELSQCFWRQQSKVAWGVRQALFCVSRQFVLIQEQAAKHKKLHKSIKSVVGSVYREILDLISQSVVSIKFSQNRNKSQNSFEKSKILDSLQIDPKFSHKNNEREEMLIRVSIMDVKQAKVYLQK